MGFADYFSRHPTSEAIPISKDDENFVINLIDSFKFLLKKADKFSSNRRAENELKQNYVIIATEQKQTKRHAFSHSLHTNQLHSLIQNSQNSNIVNVSKRNSPNRNTIEQSITKGSAALTKKTCYPTTIQIPHSIIPRLIETLHKYPQLLLLSEPKPTIVLSLVRD